MITYSGYIGAPTGVRPGVFRSARDCLFRLRLPVLGLLSQRMALRLSCAPSGPPTRDSVPARLSISLDARSPTNGSVWDNVLAFFRDGASPVSFLSRKTLEEATTFEGAVTQLASEVG